MDSTEERPSKGHETIDAAEAKAMLLKIAGDMQAVKELLTDLDAAIGDGDMGVTLTVGFSSVARELEALAPGDVGQLLLKTGMTLANSAPSTIGILLASAFMAAGKEVKGLERVGVPQAAKMAQAAVAGIQARGKAKLGDKTILDALVPASEAMSGAAAEGVSSLAEALARAVAAADEGVQATVPMRSLVGRSSWLAERTVGHQDAGATCGYLILKSASEYLRDG